METKKKKRTSHKVEIKRNFHVYLDVEIASLIHKSEMNPSEIVNDALHLYFSKSGSDYRISRLKSELDHEINMKKIHLKIDEDLKNKLKSLKEEIREEYSILNKHPEFLPIRVKLFNEEHGLKLTQKDFREAVFNEGR